MQLSNLKEEILNFNQPDSILVVSSYPEKGIKYSGKVCAVGGFAKNTIESLTNYYEQIGEKKQFVVLTVTKEKEEIYKEGNVLVWRIFKRNKISSYIRLFAAIWKFNKIKNTLVEFEFASYGDTKTTAFFPLVLLTLLFTGKRRTLVLHQVLNDLSQLTGHLGWKKKDKGFSKGYNIALTVYYFILSTLATEIIVLEKTFRDRLAKIYGNEKKIDIIPHGVDLGFKTISREQAREKLEISQKEITLLYFGYLTWYKGVDFLMEAIGEKGLQIGGKKVRLIVAGGESATQKEKKHYQEFMKKVRFLEQKAKNITVTGFVQEKEINAYFSAADLVILPYRTFMSSSGPLSISLSFNKPFIMSSRLENYFDSEDFQSALNESDLKKEEIIFTFTKKALRAKIREVFLKNNLGKMKEFAKNLAGKRDFNYLASKYARVLTEEKAYNPHFDLAVSTYAQ